MSALADLHLQQHRALLSRYQRFCAVQQPTHLFPAQLLPPAPALQPRQVGSEKEPRSRRELVRRVACMLLRVTARDEQNSNRMSEGERRGRLRGRKGELESWVVCWQRDHLSKAGTEWSLGLCERGILGGKYAWRLGRHRYGSYHDIGIL